MGYAVEVHMKQYGAFNSNDYTSDYETREQAEAAFEAAKTSQYAARYEAVTMHETFGMARRPRPVKWYTFATDATRDYEAEGVK